LPEAAFVLSFSMIIVAMRIIILASLSLRERAG